MVAQTKSPTSSPEGRFTAVQRAEARFLLRLKGALRSEIARQAKTNGLTQRALAEKAGLAPAVLSRALSADRHSNTQTLFRIAWALDREWAFELVEAHGILAKGNARPTTASEPRLLPAQSIVSSPAPFSKAI